MRDKVRAVKTSNIQAIITIMFGVCLVVINIIRIFNIPITFDENGLGPHDTYLFIVQDSIGSANDHILHSIFRKFFVDLLGNNLFSLRVDSLFAQLSFLLFTYLICRHLFKNTWWRLCSFILLNVASPLLFDFWGLSRGYGLAMSFMALSIYYLLRYMDGRKILYLSWSFVGAILAVYSNFGYINYFLSLGALVLIQNVIFRASGQKATFLKELAVMAIASVVLALLITVPLIAIYHNGELAYMGSKGFMEDTVSSVISTGFFLTGPIRDGAVNVIKYAVTIITGISGCYWLYIYFRKCYRKVDVAVEARYGISFFLLLIVHIGSLVAQHALFGINYLTDRAALFFIILFALQLIYLLWYLVSPTRGISAVLFGSLFLLSVYNFSSKVSLDRTLLWFFNADDLKALKRIADESKDKPGKIKVGVNWLFEPTFRYNTAHYYPGRFEPVVEIPRNEPLKDTSFDYIYTTLDRISWVPPGYHRIGDYIGGGIILLKKN